MVLLLDQLLLVGWLFWLFACFNLLACRPACPPAGLSVFLLVCLFFDIHQVVTTMFLQATWTQFSGSFRCSRSPGADVNEQIDHELEESESDGVGFHKTCE